MVHATRQKPYYLLGLLIWGDLGPTTLYRDRWHRTVVIPKTWPAKPPSPAQSQVRAAFLVAKNAWQALSPAAKMQWHLAARRASLCLHGYNLWMHWQLTGDDSAMQTLERQTGTDLLP